MLAIFETIRTFLVDECFVVSVPKRLVIRNPKLGILLRIAQAAIFLGLTISLLARKVWRQDLRPTPWISEFWLEEPADAEERTRLRDSNVRHCSDPRSYWEGGDAAFGPGRRALQPHGCEPLASFEASRHDNGRLFIPTLVQETEVFDGAFCHNGSTSKLGLPPNATVTKVCADTNGTNERSCSCTVDRTFLTKNPEQQRIVLRHGFRVDMSDRGQDVLQHSIMSPMFREQIWGESVQEEPGELLTIILATDGSPCKVGGRSEWPSSEARWGIIGTLGEWLMCAGVQLDAAPELFLRGAPGLARHFRTMGLVLQMRLDYHNTDDPDTCFLSFQPQVQWTTVPVVHDRLFLPKQDGDLLRAERVRKQYGVMLTTTVTGKYYAFSIRKLTSAIVELIVLFELPLIMVRFLALYCLGFISEVYRRARVTQFSIYSHFHGAIARMMLAEIGFRGLMGGVWKGKVAGTEVITLRQMTSHVQDLFQEQVKYRIMRAEDVDRIANVAFNHMRKTNSDVDSGADGGVSCHDYIRSCTADDTMDITMVTKVLCREAADGPWLSAYFDHNRRRLRASIDASLKDTAIITEPTDEPPSSPRSSRSNASRRSQSSITHSGSEISQSASMNPLAPEHQPQQQQQQEQQQQQQQMQIALTHEMEEVPFPVAGSVTVLAASSEGIETFSRKFPIDQATKDALAESSTEVSERVLNTFVPPPVPLADFSSPVMNYLRECRRLLGPGSGPGTDTQPSGAGATQIAALPAAAAGEHRDDLNSFLHRYPVDARCLDYLAASSPGVVGRVVREFAPHQEGESDYSALVMAFTKRCRGDERYGAGGGANNFGGCPAWKRARAY